LCRGAGREGGRGKKVKEKRARLTLPVPSLIRQHSGLHLGSGARPLQKEVGGNRREKKRGGKERKKKRFLFHTFFSSFYYCSDSCSSRQMRGGGGGKEEKEGGDGDGVFQVVAPFVSIAPGAPHCGGGEGRRKEGGKDVSLRSRPIAISVCDGLDQGGGGVRREKRLLCQGLRIGFFPPNAIASMEGLEEKKGGKGGHPLATFVFFPLFAVPVVLPEGRRRGKRREEKREYAGDYFSLSFGISSIEALVRGGMARKEGRKKKGRGGKKERKKKNSQQHTLRG